MKKLLSLILLFPLFISCSSDNEIIPTIEPETGDNMTIEQIVGTYILSDLHIEGLNDAIFGEKIELSFKENNTLEEFNPQTLERKQYAWTYSNKVISFENTQHGKIQGWFKNGYLKYKTYAKPNNPNRIGTYTYIKKSN
ncbi:MAG: hypothetical protein ACK5KN_11160 [Dysgonomonas sp.]|uniref:hypothetical protein n=1 Tax=Dysgonomonas sp. TaxID=1891233 RepID=UPI003A8A4D5B